MKIGKKHIWCVIGLVAVLVFCYAPPVLAQNGWWDTDWMYRVRIDIDNSNVDEDLTDFPLLICMDSDDIDYDHTEDDGSDIRFTDANGALLPHEIEDWNESGTSYVWARVDIDATEDTYIWMYYGNSSPGPPPDPEDVWSNGYAAVWHMQQDPSGSAPQILDSTSNDNDGSSAGSMTSGDQVAGKIDGSVDFDGSDDEITRNDGDLVGPIPCSTETGGTEDFTLSAWINVDAIGSHEPILKKQSDGTTPERGFGFGISSGGKVSFEVWKGDTSPADKTEVESDTLLSAHSWYHVVATYDYVSDGSSEIRLYIDGVQDSQTSDTAVGPLQNNDRRLRIGRYYWSSGYNPELDGTLDEVRISNVERSAAWIKASYYCMNDCDNFTSFSMEMTHTNRMRVIERPWGQRIFIYYSSEDLWLFATIMNTSLDCCRATILNRNTGAWCRLVDPCGVE